MGYAIKASLFLILGALVAATPAEDMKAYQAYRGPLMESLGDLSLSDEEALKKISDFVNSALDLPQNEQNKNFWIDLISGKAKYAVPEFDANFQETLSNKVKAQSKTLFQKVQALGSQGQYQKDEAALQQAQSEETTKGFKALAAEISQDLAKALLNDIKSQFAFSVNNKNSESHLESKTKTATDLVHLFIDEINNFIEQLNVDVSEDLPEEIQALVYNDVRAQDPKFHKISQVLTLITNGAYLIKIEAMYMFASIQHFSEVAAAKRVSRMALINRLLVLFGHLCQTWGDAEDFIVSIINYRKGVIRGDIPEDKAFTGIYNQVARDLIVIINQQAGIELSFDLGRRLLILCQELKQTHVIPFLLHQVKSNNLPHLPAEGAPAHSRHYLKIVSFITSLTFKDIPNAWWEEVMIGFDNLLQIDSGVLNMLSYVTLQLSEPITALANHEEFLGIHFNALLEFLEVNGEYLIPETYFQHFSKFLDLIVEKSELAKKYYFLLKLQNIYAAPTTAAFPIDFNVYAADENAAKELGKFATESGYETLSKITWNAFVRKTKNNKGSALRAFAHFKEFSGQKAVDFMLFNHANFQFTVDSSVKQKRPSSSFKDVVIKISDSQANLSLKKVNKDKSPNKITIDAGETEIDDLAVEEVKPEVKNVETPAIVVVNIPNAPLEKLVEEQIKENKQAEKIEEQIIQILKEPEPEVKQAEDNQPSNQIEEPAKLHDIDEAPKKETPVEQKAETVTINEIAGALTPKEKKLLEQKNLRELIGQVSEIIDEDGNVTKLVYAKVIPHQSDCFKSIFA